MCWLIHKKLFKLNNSVAVLFCYIFFGCQTPISETFDLDIRSAGRLPVEDNRPCFSQIMHKQLGVGMLLAHNFLSDTIYHYEVNKTVFFFFKENTIAGVTGSDNFIFAKDSLVYQVSVSNEMSPDNQHYVSAFRYGNGICTNYEGKAPYFKHANIDSIKKLDVLKLLNLLQETDTLFFTTTKKGFRLSGYL